jgi:hypothetical protein
MAFALASGKGVIAETDARILWENVPNIILPRELTPHAVIVTGIEYDDNGNIINIIINDRGTGNCSRKILIDQWNRALQSRNDAKDSNGNHYAPATILVTDSPIFY